MKLHALFLAAALAAGSSLPMTAAGCDIHDDCIYAVTVEQKPQFPGGEDAMYRWIAENRRYPVQAMEEGVQGRVVVSFIVEKDGSLSNVKVVRSRHPELDREAVRLVQSMPRWTPGRNNGEVVRVTYNLPVTFKLPQ